MQPSEIGWILRSSLLYKCFRQVITLLIVIVAIIKLPNDHILPFMKGICDKI